MSWSTPGKVAFSAPLSVSALYRTAPWVYTLHHVTDSLPPCPHAPHTVWLSILGNVFSVQIEILDESFPDSQFPRSLLFLHFPFRNLSVDFTTHSVCFFTSHHYQFLCVFDVSVLLPHTHFFTYAHGSCILAEPSPSFPQRPSLDLFCPSFLASTQTGAPPEAVCVLVCVV